MAGVKPSLWDAFKQYLGDAAPGGALNPEVTPQGLLDFAAMATMPIPVVGDAIGVSADMKRMYDNPGERTLANAGLLALGALPLVPSGLGKVKNMRRLADKNVKINAGAAPIMASKTPSIYDPKPLPQRGFYDDYPQGIEGPDGSRIEVDIEGRPITARYVAGRRVLGGVDEGLSPSETHGVADALGIPVFQAQRSGPDLKGDVGRYVRGENKSIFLDESLSDDKPFRVLQHELGHAVDDMSMGIPGKKGSKIPTSGLSQELQRIYEDLNTGGYYKPGRGTTPKGQGYAEKEIDAELIAEAVRAYMRDPNYIKTIAPKTAKRIREYVNNNPNLKKVIQFNTVGPIVTTGLLSLLMNGQDGEEF